MDDDSDNDEPGVAVSNGQQTKAESDKKAGTLRTTLTSWLALFAAVLSLIVSVTSLLNSTQDPDVQLVLPDKIRMVQGGSSPSILYFEPTFVSTGRNDRLDVILDIEMVVTPMSDTTDVATFSWSEIGSWDYDRGSRSVSYVFTSDAKPLSVSPSNAQLPLCLFTGPEEWSFRSGEYSMTIKARRSVGVAPLERTFLVKFSAAEILRINSSNGRTFLTFDIEPRT